MLADDDDEEATAGAVRYPVMPSLVSLQQMRNRLHMGHLGRKLMKWTSIATGTELRRISAELLTLYDTFAEDMREAFIMLARCRYFFPDLNKMVIEDIQSWASVTVASHTKTITGVRIIEYFIVETDTAYDYLGLGQGGEMIEETKRFWIQLLKLMIKMAELRTSFALVEAVHKAATKKMNVLNKLIIPRANVTITFIKTELDEKEREEHFRMKIIQSKKNKKKKKKEVCKVCKEMGDIRTRCVVCGVNLNEPPPPPQPPPPDFEVMVTMKEQLSNILDLSKEIANKSLADNMETFIKNASQMKMKLEELTIPTPIPSDISADKLCKVCSQRQNEERGNKPKYSPEPSHTDVPDSRPNEECLGTIITDEEVITRLLKVRNKDGTLSEQRRVIKRRRETNTISNTEPSATALGSGNNILFVTMPQGYSNMSVKSDVIKGKEIMSDPQERCCVSCIDIHDDIICFDDLSCKSLYVDAICDSKTCERDVSIFDDISELEEKNSDDTITTMSEEVESKRQSLFSKSNTSERNTKTEK